MLCVYVLLVGVRGSIIYLVYLSTLTLAFIACQLSGSFNPYSSDPLPASPKKQLILKIISGQQLPKPPDSMLGDRGEVKHSVIYKCFYGRS